MEITVGIVGTGSMGGAMAARLLERGCAVQACDLRQERVEALVRHGARAAAVPAQAAAGAQVLIVCVVDAPQVREVLFGPAGAAAALPTGAAVLLCPTIAPQDVEDVAARLAEQGLVPIDAPMSGGPARAREGTMSLMVACSEATLEAQRPLLALLATHLFHVGVRPGDGARTKLVNNLLAAINLAGAAEALALAERLGLDAARTLDVIQQSSGQSWIGTDRMRRALAGDFAPRAQLTLLQKDSGLALAAADAAGFRCRLGPVARATFDAAVAAGDADLDDGALLRLFRSA